MTPPSATPRGKYQWTRILDHRRRERARQTQARHEATLAKLTAQYDDFCEFAQNRLSRSGRAHQTEISRAFRDAYPQYDESVLDESEFRRSSPTAPPPRERSPRGYYKNLSLVKSERVSVKDLGV